MATAARITPCGSSAATASRKPSTTFTKRPSQGQSRPARATSALRKLLRRFMDVCNAIDYAHSRGVIHRDIKPANIIVGKYGETLVVDWGLAKPMGRVEPGTGSGERLLMPSSASGSSETLPGSALGTPAYMSPEQAEGQLERLGPRSDVYSLGATLYCLLTGQPPFAGDVVDVIRAVQKGDFRPPRQLDPNIDPALEAICLKAMAHKPEDRYASSRALADDLDRWMADEPVTAWREPFARRARRWARRNRTAMTAAAVALVAGVVGLSAVLAVQTRAKADLRRQHRGPRATTCSRPRQAATTWPSRRSRPFTQASAKTSCSSRSSSRRSATGCSSRPATSTASSAPCWAKSRTWPRGGRCGRRTTKWPS